MSGTVCLRLHQCVHTTVHVCWCVCVCVSLCPCVAVCTSPGAATPDSCRASREQPPCPPSLLSFIIICHKTEPRRTVINKGHLKYETITLTLGNISSVEQLVPPLSSWKGVPGAASPCPASSGSLLPTPSLASVPAALVLEGLGSLESGVEGGPPHRPLQARQGGPQFALLGCAVEDWVSD